MSYAVTVPVIATAFPTVIAVPVPDIGVFGRYTYLVTELLWGTIALLLLWHADAVRTAARTILVLYPFAYVWDWYTLKVGVFAIPLRTGIELLGIPLEEHIFMLVVPALVVGIHETLRTHSIRTENTDVEAETKTKTETEIDRSPNE